MSLLYECINGIIQGEILESADGAREGEEVASLCVGKLQGMIASDGDPNRQSIGRVKYMILKKLTPWLSEICSAASLQQNCQISPAGCGSPR